MKRNLVGKILGKIKIFVQDFVPIRTAVKRNLVGKILGKIKIFVQDFVPIRTALRVLDYSSEIVRVGCIIYTQYGRRISDYKKMVIDKIRETYLELIFR